MISLLRLRLIYVYFLSSLMGVELISFLGTVFKLFTFIISLDIK